MICENCGKEHDGGYGSGRFCSKECARSFSTKKSQGQLKEAKCIDCGKTIYIGKRASSKKCRCEECNKIHYYNLHPKKIKIKQTNNTKNICKICGSINHQCKDVNVCSHYRLFPTLIKFGLDSSKLGTEKIIDEYYKIKDIIEYEYKINRITEKELKEKYNYNSGISNFHKILKSLNINSYNSHDAVKISISLGRLNPGFDYQHFKEYLHKSWEGNIYHLRSSYEDIYANELDRNKIKYDYENLRIKYWDSQKQEYRYSIPDFYLIDDNIIVEIKSSYTLDKQNMIDKFKAYKELGYNCKLICDFKEMPL